MEEYLREYIGLKIKRSDGQEVYIGSDFPDEYAHSRYTGRLKGALAKVKANAAQMIVEMIECTAQLCWEENWESKHMWNAKYGWYRGNICFAIPVCDNADQIVGFNVYRGTMIFRHDKDRKIYLYDLINIKKEPSTPPGLMRTVKNPIHN